MARVAIEKYIVFNPVVRLCGVGRFSHRKIRRYGDNEGLAEFVECRLL